MIAIRQGKLALVALILMMLPQTGNAQSAGIWVEIDTTKLFPATVSPADAHTQTVAFARQCALRKAVPEEVYTTSVLTDFSGEDKRGYQEQTAYSIFALSSVAGLITEEKIVQTGVSQFKGDVYTYRVHLKARIEQTTGKRDPSLDLKIELVNNLLHEGDELQLQITSNRDGYLYLFDFLADNSVLLMYPNPISKQNVIKGNQVFRIPTEHEKRSGVRYRVTLPPGVTMSSETILAVFSVRPIAGIDQFQAIQKSFATFSAGDESFSRFQRWLANVPLSERIEKAAPVQIMKRGN